MLTRWLQGWPDLKQACKGFCSAVFPHCYSGHKPNQIWQCSFSICYCRTWLKVLLNMVYFDSPVTVWKNCQKTAAFQKSAESIPVMKPKTWIASLKNKIVPVGLSLGTSHISCNWYTLLPFPSLPTSVEIFFSLSIVVLDATMAIFISNLYLVDVV